MKGINYLPKHQLHSVKTLFVEISREGVFLFTESCAQCMYILSGWDNGNTQLPTRKHKPPGNLELQMQL